jgi:hypothetical protein
LCFYFRPKHDILNKKNPVNAAEEVAHLTWAREQEDKTGIKQNVRPAFSA